MQRHIFKSGLNAANVKLLSKQGNFCTLTPFACVGAEVKSLPHQLRVFLIAYDILISTSLKFSAFPYLNHSA